MTVKGSSQHRMLVVPWRPWLYVAIAMGLCTLIILTGWVSFQAGIRAPGFSPSPITGEPFDLQRQLESTRYENAELRQQVANLTLGAKIDREATEELRQQVIQLKSTIATLDEDITFYRGLMSPSGQQKGVAFGAFSLAQTEKPGRFDYKLTVQQFATRHELVSGWLNVDIVGRQDGKLLRLPLDSISADNAKRDIKLRFKYFQNISGSMELPEGFEPERIDMAVHTQGKTPAEIKKTLAWAITER